MEEIWKDIKGYEGKYQVSSLGRVKSLNYRNKGIEQILKLDNYLDYSYIALSGKTFKVHKLVATHFIPNPDNLRYINHKDENKRNNSVDNLEWCTFNYNMNYGTRNKRIAEKKRKQVRCVETGEIFPSQQFLKGKGINIQHVLSGKYKTCRGYHWEYV